MSMGRILLIIAGCLWLTACATTETHFDDSKGNTATLEGLKDLHSSPPTVKKKVDVISSMREAALKETAMSIGAQSGLHWRAAEVNQTLEERSSQLDRIYNFGALLLPHNILPPVLTEARQTLNLDGPDTIRLADRAYEIISQAQFVTTPPTWRDYLWMHYPLPAVPDKSVLPQTPQEVKLWKELIDKGWKEGIQQANEIYAQNLSRLERDYNGMLLYRNLRAQNMVSAPFVAKTNLGVTGGGSSLNINDQILRITALPALQSNSQQWNPALRTEQQ